MKIGWKDKDVPTGVEVPASDIIRTEAIRKARAHLAIERGHKHARRHACALAKMLKRLDAAAAKQGLTLTLETSNLSTAPKPWDWLLGLALEVLFIRDRRIVADIALCSFGSWARTRSSEWHSPMHTADATLRRILADAEAERQRRAAEVRRRADEWLSKQPNTVQEAYKASGARPTCLRCTETSISEALHDVGGSATWAVEGDLVETMRGHQQRHDEVYHAEVERC